MNSDRGDFLSIGPHAGATFQTSRWDAAFCQRINDDLLDGANISHHVALPFSQIEDGITDDLAGAVIGNVAAAVGGKIGDPSAGQDFFAREQIFLVPVAAESDGVGMLDYEELVGNFLSLALFNEIFLDGECGRVAEP